MRTAIALFGNRIAPRFDCTQEFMLVTVSEQRVTGRETQRIGDDMSIAKVRRLADLEVDLLICGGVDEKSRHHLRHYGIGLLANIKGEVEEALASYLDGRLARMAPKARRVPSCIVPPSALEH